MTNYFYQIYTLHKMHLLIYYICLFRIFIDFIILFKILLKNLSELNKIIVDFDPYFIVIIYLYYNHFQYKYT
jgi:hypothetical protein